MNCWKTLGIMPTGDASLIKKAYASLLKVHRPDEDPAGFSKLNHAYKQCLQLSKQQHYSDEKIDHIEEASKGDLLSDSRSSIDQLDYDDQDESNQDKQEENHSSITVSSQKNNLVKTTDTELLKSSTPEGEDSIKLGHIGDDEDTIFSEDSLEKAKESLIQLTESAINKMLKTDKPDDWQFITSYEELYDIHFRIGYSDYVFQQILALFHDNKIKPKARQSSLLYLDNIFGWSDQEKKYEEEYGYENIYSIFDILIDGQNNQETPIKWSVEPRHKGPIEQAGYYKRIFANMIDIILYVIVSSSLLNGDNIGDHFISLIGFFLIMNAMMEASPMQGSLGKVLFGIKVTTYKGRRLNILHALLRQLIYCISTLSFKITVWVNLFLNDGRLLHDRISRSIAIKR